MKCPDLDNIQQEVFNKLMERAEEIEKLEKSERLKAINKLFFDIQAVVPPIQLVRMLYAYHQWNQSVLSPSSQD